MSQISSPLFRSAKFNLIQYEARARLDQWAALPLLDEIFSGPKFTSLQEVFFTIEEETANDVPLTMLSVWKQLPMCHERVILRFKVMVSTLDADSHLSGSWQEKGQFSHERRSPCQSLSHFL